MLGYAITIIAAAVGFGLALGHSLIPVVSLLPTLMR
jgi:hypothetical protein